MGKDGGSAKSEIAKYSVSGNEIYINKFLEKKVYDILTRIFTSRPV